jgi:hypothetical protein
VPRIPPPCHQASEHLACRPGELDHPQALAFDGDVLLVANTGYGQPWARGSLAFVDVARGRVEAVLPTTWQNPQALVRVERATIGASDDERLAEGQSESPTLGSADGGWWVADTGLYDFTGEVPHMATAGGLDHLAPGAQALVGFVLPHGAAGHGGGPTDLVVVGDRLFVSSGIAARVYLFDLTDKTWLRGAQDPIEYGTGLGLGSLATDGDRVFVIDYNSDRLHVLDGRTGEPTGCVVDLGEVAGLEGAKAPLVVGGDLFYVLDQAGLLRRLPLAGLAGTCPEATPETVAVTGLLPNHLASDGERLYLVHSGENNITVLGLPHLRTEAVHVLPPGSNPWHVALQTTPEGTRLAVSEWAASGITLIEPDATQRRLRCGEGGGPAPTPGLDPVGTARLADEVRAAPSASERAFRDPAAATNGVRGGGVQGGLDVFSLGVVPGVDDHVVLCWSDGPVLDGPGPDLVVFENPFPGFVDPVIVEVSPDGQRWVTFPHDYTAEDESTYDPDPTRWQGFAGVTPVWLHEEDNRVDPFGAAAGGDAFDLAGLDDAQVQAEGVVCVRLVSAQARINPDTGGPFVVDAISDGADVDGVYGR